MSGKEIDISITEGGKYLLIQGDCEILNQVLEMFGNLKNNFSNPYSIDSSPHIRKILDKISLSQLSGQVDNSD